jgi:hypothetical protein
MRVNEEKVQPYTPTSFILPPPEAVVVARDLVGTRSNETYGSNAGFNIFEIM